MLRWMFCMSVDHSAGCTRWAAYGEEAGLRRVTDVRVFGWQVALGRSKSTLIMV